MQALQISVAWLEARFVAPAAQPLARPVYTMLAAAAAAIAAGFLGTSFSWDAATLNLPLLMLALGWASAYALRGFGYASAGEVLEALVVMFAVSVAGALASLLLAATSAPFADEALVRADAALFFGFRWDGLMAALQGQELLLRLASIAYSTLSWQPALLIGLLLVRGERRRCWTFLAAWAAALALTVAIFPFAPALGGFLHFGIEPAQVRGVMVPAAWHHADVLEPIRDGTLRLIGTPVLEGVVTFPSFHAAGAVLLAWGWSGLRFARWPALALNAAMFLASIAIGGHYLVDVAAGGLIAWAGIALAGRWIEARPPLRP